MCIRDRDYGSARWVNIDQKGGGRYLAENHSYAKQSVAHNTLVINEISHYEGKVKKAEANHPEQYFFDSSDPNIHAVRAKEMHAYPDVEMHRTLFLLKDENFRNPLLIDVFRVASEKENQYDLPTWFQGHLLSANFEYEAQTQQLTTLGNAHGYQHLWKEASGKSDGKGNQVTWFRHLNNGGGQKTRGKFFTLTTSSQSDDELIFVRAGANDPNFNLRHDPAFIQRRKGTSTVFASVIEAHGTYNPVSEIPMSPFSGVQSVLVLHDSKEYTVIKITHQSGKTWTVAIANEDTNEMSDHQVKKGNEVMEWEGVFGIKIEN